jgi:hypothetical protein
MTYLTYLRRRKLRAFAHRATERADAENDETQEEHTEREHRGPGP